ncbi:MAG: hypothetical protein BWY63_02649 [Chloroflexi bacterium ADurb.Bin360]|nr:MAG: hypothetical protein BWY63_02649 [Chloroflexi bacterium ADurb.Bin360]
MGKPVQFQELLAPIRQALERLPEHLYFPDWQALLMFMYQRLGLPPSASPDQNLVDLLTRLHAA